MMLRRLLYRETPFEPLTDAELRRLDAAFGEMVAGNPLIYYWVHRIDGGRWLITDFFHPSMLRYRGLEFVLVERGTVSYYRLPGAKVGGTGHVAAGDYRVSITSPAGAAFLTEIRKNALGRLELLGVSAVPAGGASPSHVELPRHPLEPSKFADEMKAAIAGGVEWVYRRYRSADDRAKAALADELRDARWPRAVRGASPETDTYLWMLEQSIA
ncbi:hypothetical protein [Burkholderia oklahomensis]|uniref:hypothetical protein n=1 Tax=Burkholderia oklahomensis TaxID=342113 RepID=UPI00016A7F6A|nr:hypothetical protein [Burkholderia oklahomensis]AJX35159.1 hypothetical protein BG90_5367 [Burkholderia oklahomensis C6786]AOI49023.1 hypothetical protein WI23_24795 [Burkholderia oklahomensis C6786]KUY61072.1 hypothetical protein WI23_12565 [Burkholderia oklahomensis C6786]MBI0362754.1 hypothetical protein [Burkholderia oklahomensis]SUY26863.1 Uncharacterised protein [Burkholderia oklahomensis]